MKAIGYKKLHALADATADNGLTDITLPDPSPTGHDILVEVKAISVNPVDTKVRMRDGAAPGHDYKVLGYDASGVVKAVGPEVTLFKAGDKVWYAGSIARPGTNSELHLVDERIVGHMPASLGFAEAAALPLTSITAWEMLFDRLAIPKGDG
ncbi:MAG: alcohol dehydrogenase catalytic domain-containing protein, partial [Pseudomonadota bacterium]